LFSSRYSPFTRLRFPAKYSSVENIYCCHKKKRFQCSIKIIQASSLLSLTKLLCGSHAEDVVGQGSVPPSVHVSDGEVGGETAQRYDLGARHVAGAATCRVAADVRTAASVYRRHAASASRESTLLAAPQPKRTSEFLAELTCNFKHLI